MGLLRVAASHVPRSEKRDPRKSPKSRGPDSAEGQGASSAGAIRSTPSWVRTEPRCAPKREPARAFCSNRRRMARATASVLLPCVNFLAASSIRATTSGRLMVTTLATIHLLESLCQYLYHYFV